MSTEFDSVVIDWFNGLAWVDLSSDVMKNPAPRGSRGIMSTRLADRVGGVGAFSMSLNNAEDNSVQTEGYYTPGHPNCISSVWGKPYYYPIRITTTYQERTKKIRYASFEKGPEGVRVVSGDYGARRVDVKFRDWMGLAEERKLNLLGVSTTQRIEEAVQLILDTLNDWELPQRTDFKFGDSTFPTVFDNLNSGSTVYSELVKLALSELGYIYLDSDSAEGETLVVYNRNRRFLFGNQSDSSGATSVDSDKLLIEDGTAFLLEEGDYLLLNSLNNAVSSISKSVEECGFLLLENGDYLLLEDGDMLILNEVQSAEFDGFDVQTNRDMRVNYYDEGYQSAKISSQQKTVDTTLKVLWSMSSPMFIEAGQTITDIRGRYRDPSGGASYVNGENMQTPASGTDFIAKENRDGTGATLTGNISVVAEYGSAEVEYTSIVNSGAAAWITVLQARGLGIYNYDSLDILLGDNEGKRLDIDLNYETDAAIGRSYAEDIIRVPDGSTTIQRLPLFANLDTFNMNAWMDLKISSLYNVSDNVSYPETNNPYFINGYEFEIIDMKYIFWYPNGFPFSRLFIPD